jgi:hypothetical protein
LSVALEGKFLLSDKSQRNTVVGQAVRRGKLLIRLQAGLGREFVVVPFYDRTHVGFLKLDHKYQVFLSEPEPMLEKQAGVWCALPGFQKLLRVCQDPGVSGFRRCPLPAVCESDLDITLLTPLFAGRAGRKLFCVGDCVLKVQDEDRATMEIQALRRLEGLVGVPKLETKESFKVYFPGEELVRVGFVTSPLGVTPDCSKMQPHHGAFLARVLAGAASRKILHGDVSPDNIIQADKDLILIDWGSSSSGGGVFQGMRVRACVCFG